MVIRDAQWKRVYTILYIYKCTSWKVWLKDMRWPSFSVSTRTPSQSNRRAEGRVEEEEADAEQLNLRGGTLSLVVVVVIPNVVVGLDILREACVVKDDDDGIGT